MNISELLQLDEGKTIEYKENTKSLSKIIKTIIAFVNTAGGKIIIGVTDKEKKIVGVENILTEEEKLANSIADSIEPILLPDIDIVGYEGKELIIINVPYLATCHYYKAAGRDSGTFVRLGSTNRLADSETLTSLMRAAKNISFDEMPCPKASVDDLEKSLIDVTLKPIYQTFTKRHYSSLGITTLMHNKERPSYGGLLLFAKHRIVHLPDSIIRCVCYAGTTREKIIDQKEITENLLESLNHILAFIKRHTSVAANIGPIKREDVPQFPPVAVREAIVNALMHADYSIFGSSIQIAMYSNRVEISNPGSLPLGQSMKSAQSGISKIRNRVIGKIFRELKIIEQLGSGIPRIFATYDGLCAEKPLFEEIDNNFKVTLYSIITPQIPNKEWEFLLLNALREKALSTKEIAEIWGISLRSTRDRLKSMMDKHLVSSTAKTKTDPAGKYTLYKNFSIPIAFNPNL